MRLAEELVATGVVHHCGSLVSTGLAHRHVGPRGRVRNDDATIVQVSPGRSQGSVRRVGQIKGKVNIGWSTDRVSLLIAPSETVGAHHRDGAHPEDGQEFLSVHVVVPEVVNKGMEHKAWPIMSTRSAPQYQFRMALQLLIR